jgi:hypothetical protein
MLYGGVLLRRFSGFAARPIKKPIKNLIHIHDFDGNTPTPNLSDMASRVVSLGIAPAFPQSRA